VIEAQDVLGEIAEVVERGEMPLRAYLPLHPRARLEAAERTRLVEWATAQRSLLLREGVGTGP
jgi:hypothetical protein